ncbi:hypothetical protein C2G38_2028170 [Gigaspora rosea]|uniref:Uncharacterized protein n=1 Tax=Gigaspora rosea TaxID=44941 RepID=A0A397W2H4_9GLOM|nr:hypothetical protein C2G38_2028170 [Gigaspora rosea]
MKRTKTTKEQEGKPQTILDSDLNNKSRIYRDRVTPVGYDSKGNTYWLFDDNRLCKESPKKDASKKQKSKVKNTRHSRAKHVTPEVNKSIAESMNWETVCVTRWYIFC